MTPQQLQTESTCFSCLPGQKASQIYLLNQLSQIPQNCWSPDEKPGSTWVNRTTPADNNWMRCLWISELSKFVAIADSGTLNQVMTSPDGITWTIQTTPQNNQWNSIAWSPTVSGGLIVAVAGNGTNRVMTSPDGVTWTLRTAAQANAWNAVAWSPTLSLYAAVSINGTNRVMTSPDGVNWTIRNAAAANAWERIIWASTLGMFVAVSTSGVGNRVMTSVDGINWVSRTSAADVAWRALAFRPSPPLLFSAPSDSTTSGMISTDGINWSTVTIPSGAIRGALYVTELEQFIVSSRTVLSSIGHIMVSEDATSWSVKVTPDQQWEGIAWSPLHCRLAVVARTGTLNRAMTSG